MLLPYRCKNPPEQFPYATIGLIAVNVLIYLCTTNDFLSIKDGIVADYAVKPSHLNPITLIVSMFLHGEPLHIGGNMLFLWLFGAAVEGRMRIPKYLLLYFASGIVGGLTQCLAEASIGKDIPGFGASGAIMGLAGAYIYVFPFARIMVFRINLSLIFFRFGPAEWLAWWVVAYYMGLNILNGIIAQSLGVSGGVGYFAHIGGFGTGLLVALALRVRRDSEFVSQVQATRVDASHDLTLLSCTELEALLEHPTENMKIVLTYCDKVMMQFQARGEAKSLAMIERYREQLLAGPDIEWLSQIVLRISKTSGVFQGPFYLKLGGKLEQIGQHESASYIYRRAYEVYGTMPDGGAALFRLARLWEGALSSPEEALDAYGIYVEYFAHGPLIEDAKKGVARLNAQKLSALPPAKVQRQIPQQSSRQQMTATQQSAEALPIDSRAVAAPDLEDSRQAG